MPLDALALHELCVRHAPAGIAGVAHDAGLRAQSVDGDLQFLGGEREEDGARLGDGAAQHGAELADVQRTERPDVPGADFRVGHDHVDGVEIDIELFCDELRERGLRTLSQLDLADEARGAPVRTYTQVGVEIRRVARAAGKPAGFLGDQSVDPEENDETGAAGKGHELAPAESALLAAHRAPSGRGPAAAVSMASRMRTCEPQRHRLSSMCRTISARVGLGFLRSSACAFMIIPVVQTGPPSCGKPIGRQGPRPPLYKHPQGFHTRREAGMSTASRHGIAAGPRSSRRSWGIRRIQRERKKRRRVQRNREGAGPPPVKPGAGEVRQGA